MLAIFLYVAIQVCSFVYIVFLTDNSHFFCCAVFCETKEQRTCNLLFFCAFILLLKQRISGLGGVFPSSLSRLSVTPGPPLMGVCHSWQSASGVGFPSQPRVRGQDSPRSWYIVNVTFKPFIWQYGTNTHTQLTFIAVYYLKLPCFILFLRP